MATKIKPDAQTKFDKLKNRLSAVFVLANLFGYFYRFAIKNVFIRRSVLVECVCGHTKANEDCFIPLNKKRTGLLQNNDSVFFGFFFNAVGPKGNLYFADVRFLKNIHAKP